MSEPLVTPVADPRRGCLLVATPLLEDPNFRRSVIFVIEHGSEGSLGVVLNRPWTRSSEPPLPKWLARKVILPKVYVGGPVQPDAVLALVPSSADLPGGSKITEQVAMLDLEVETGMSEEHLEVVQFYCGYSGWSPGQLRLEIEEGAWWTFDSSLEEFLCDPSDCWRTVLARQRSAASLLSIYPDQAYMN